MIKRPFKISMAVTAIVFLFSFFIPITNGATDYSRKTLNKFKGFMIGHSETAENIRNDAAKIKDMGINIIAVRPDYCIKQDGSIELIMTGPPMGNSYEQEYINRIRYAHQNGLAVFLELNTLNPYSVCQMFEINNKDKFIKNFIAESVYWAKIAENEKVELYSPLNEPNLILGKEKTIEWANKALTGVKKFYSGDVVLKLAEGEQLIDDCFGYDYIALDVFPREINDWKTQIEEALRNMQVVAKKNNLKGIFFGEVGSPVQKDLFGAGKLIAGKISDADIQAKVFEVIFENSWDEVKGYFILEWSNQPTDSYVIKDPAKKVIDSWYRKN